MLLGTLKVAKDYILGNRKQIYDRLAKLELDNDECMKLHATSERKIGTLEAHVAHCKNDHRLCEERVSELRREGQELRGRLQNIQSEVELIKRGQR